MDIVGAAQVIQNGIEVGAAGKGRHRGTVGLDALDAAAINADQDGHVLMDDVIRYGLHGYTPLSGGLYQTAPRGATGGIDMQALRSQQERTPIILPPGTKGALSIKEAAEWCSIGQVLAYKLARRGDWPTIKIGEGVNARIIVPTAALMEWMRDNIGETIPTNE